LRTPALIVLSMMSHGVNQTSAQSLTVKGAAESVYSWKTQRCADLNIPDEPFRALRRDDGEIVGFLAHSTTRAVVFTSTGRVRNDCKPIFESEDNPDPSAFSYRTWIAATWTDDGKTVFALADNEFHGQKVAGACPYPTYLQCWFNAVIVLRS